MNLLICDWGDSSCQTHTFVILTGDGEKQADRVSMWIPLTILCTGCGHRVNIAAYWIGNADESDEETP